ncbi:MAG: hypothetical protein P4L10_06105 [Acidobacteriaceae bacterium]|jgi:hypothetical protein|nr:hypothetical protein [Acidobacteriaceae bacterium]
MNTAGDRNEQKFEAMLTAALERQPQVAIPANFAARVAASMPVRKAARVTHYGVTAAYLCILLLTAGLAILAATHPVSWMNLHSMVALLEMALTAELLLLFVFAELWQTQ